MEVAVEVEMELEVDEELGAEKEREVEAEEEVEVEVGEEAEVEAEEELDEEVEVMVEDIGKPVCGLVSFLGRMLRTLAGLTRDFRFFSSMPTLTASEIWWSVYRRFLPPGFSRGLPG